MRVLSALMRHPGRVRSRDELLTEVWEDDFVTDEVLTQSIAQLRRAFGDDPRSPEVIATVPGRGYRLLLEPRGEPPAIAARRHETPLVGRERERALITAALDEGAQHGLGRVVLISGEAGIGKTRLAQEMAAAALGRGYLLLETRCSESDAPSDSIPIVDIAEQSLAALRREEIESLPGDSLDALLRTLPRFRQLIGRSAPPARIPPEQRRRHLVRAVSELLERVAELRPLFVLLDDLQFADDATWALLRQLAADASHRPVMLVGTIRGPSLGPGYTFHPVVNELLGQRLATLIALQRLANDEVARLLECLSGAPSEHAVVDWFAQASGGNPFFVEELVHHVRTRSSGEPTAGSRIDLPPKEWALPAVVHSVIQERIERLGAATRTLLTAGAVLGRTFDPALARRLTTVAEADYFTATDEAERAGILTPTASGDTLRYEFTHDLIRGSLTAAISEVHRRELHRRAADGIEALYPDPDDHAQETLWHLERAGPTVGDEPRLARLASLAAAAAFDLANHEDALRYLDLAIASEHDRHRLARLQLRRGTTLRGLSRWEEAIDAWTNAISAFEELGDVELVVRACSDVAVMAIWRVRWNNAIDVTERALALLSSSQAVERARLLCIAGLAHCGAGRLDDGNRMIAEAGTIAERSDDPHLPGFVDFYLGASAFYQMLAPRQLELARASLARLDAKVDMWDLAPALEGVHMALYCLGRLEEMADLEQEVERVAERVGHTGTTRLLAHTRAYRQLLVTGDIGGFEAGAHARLDASAEAGLSMLQAQAHIELGQAASWRGDDARAVDHLTAARTIEPIGPDFGAAVAEHVLFLARRGNHGALELLETIIPLLPDPGRPTTIGSWKLLLAAVEAFARLGALERAAALYPVVLHAMRVTGASIPHWSTVSFARIAGIGAACAGRWDDAHRHFHDAWEECERLPNLPERPHVTRWWAWALDREDAPGKGARVRALRARTHAMARELGMRAMP